MASANYANIKHAVRLSLGCKSSKISTPWPSQLTLKRISQTGDRLSQQHFAEAKFPKKTKKTFFDGLFIYLPQI